MSGRTRDISNILQYYVKRQSRGELEFIEEQKRAGVKVCDTIRHQRSRDGRDEVVIESQLSLRSTEGIEGFEREAAECSGDSRACTALTKASVRSTDNSSGELTGSSLANSDYFIKELRISHVGKSKSLDDNKVNNIENFHETSLTTVVGKTNTEFETVYKAVIEHSESGRQLLQQDSFVRYATKLPSSYHSLPGRITNSVSLQSGKDHGRKKSNKNKTWTSIFSRQKKSQKKEEVNLSNIDLLVRQRVFESLEEPKIEARSATSPMSLSRDVPFHSHKIGGPLQPMKKKKKIPEFLKCMLSPTGSLTRSGLWTPKHKARPSDQGGKQHVKEYSTNTLSGVPVTRIVATLSKDKDEADFTYCTNADAPVITDRRRVKSGVDNVSNFHFDMSISDNQARRKNSPEKLCECRIKRLDVMARGINSVIKNSKTDDILQELDEFDKTTFHFKNCQYNTPTLRRRRDSCDSSHQSRLSLYQSCEHCENVDNQLHPEISVHLLPVIHRLENGDEINFNEDHLKFFLKVSCYKEFEKGMRQAIGTKCSIRNLAHLHYVTRKVVRHIGDPNEEDNDQIRRIMHFADQYCADHFNSHIEAHGSVEEFLKSCNDYDID